MSEEFLFYYILIVHWFADFVLQTHKQAINKSSSNKYLFYHVGVYSLVWLYSNFFFLSIFDSYIFALVTFLAHFVTDYITSRAVKKLFSKQDYHNGFVVIGLDQIAHYTQLYLTFKFLI